MKCPRLAARWSVFSSDAWQHAVCAHFVPTMEVLPARLQHLPSIARKRAVALVLNAEAVAGYDA